MQRILIILIVASTLVAQSESEKDSSKLFQSDRKQVQEERLTKQGEALKVDAAPEGEVQFSASQVEQRQKENSVFGRGNVLISGEGVQVQADQGTYNLETKDVDVSGQVVITSGQGELSASGARFNLNDKTGEFDDASFLIEQGSFNLSGKTLKKVSEDEYEILDAEFTTCQCPDGNNPWSITASRCFARQEGHGHAYNATFWMYGAPIAYTPYLLFPVKTERSSGLLAPRYGYSDRDGFELRLPTYIVLDETSDLLFTPFLESKTRRGLSGEYRQALDKGERLRLRGIFSDETPRENAEGVKDLRGTDTTGIFDPSIDSNRIGGLAQLNWKSDNDVAVPSTVVVDGRYASDNLLTREIHDSGIANYTSNYIPSTAVMRNRFGEYVSSDLSLDYTQDLSGDQDFALQRLPRFGLDATRTVRPFGFNPYGFKIITGLSSSYTVFDRDKGVDGERFNLTPSLIAPLRYQNIISTRFRAAVTANQYSINDFNDNFDSDSASTTVPQLTYDLNTSLERVYEVEQGGTLQSLFSFGAKNQNNALRRIKHTIEPLTTFQYVPDEEFDDTPNFESSIDRIREKQAVAYGVTSRLYGRYLPDAASDDKIQEIAPELEDIDPSYGTTLLDELSGGFIANRSSSISSLRSGETRELANFSLLELYDRKLDVGKDSEGGFSDLYGVINIMPSNNLTVGFGSTYNRDDSEVTSTGTGANFTSDRGDAIKVRYNFVRDSVNEDKRDKISQLEFGTEVVLADRLRLGYFGRYDSKESDFLENRGALRLLSACDCWSFDVGYSQTTNPDRDKVMATFTFTGLGDLTQDLPFLRDRLAKDEE